VWSVPLLAIAAAGASALLFDLTLPLRLPGNRDWAEAAAALRVRAGSADAVQLWPPWAERARLFVRSVPVRTEEDLRAADYPGVERLWLLALPRLPLAHLARARETLRERGATAGDELRFGAVSLQPWELHGPRVLSFLTSRNEEHEVDYVPRQCTLVRIGRPGDPGRLQGRGEGGVLHVRAGMVGERAYQKFRGPVRVDVQFDGAPLATLTVPPTAPPEPGWRRLDVAAPAGEHEFIFLVSARDVDRTFCLAAWTTAP
jgi:hypothetical protein